MKFEDLGGKSAMITGGARGLGYSLASALAGQGCNVALLDLLDDVEQSAETLATGYGVRSVGLRADVTDPSAVEQAFASAEAVVGTPDVLLTAAGITIWGASVDVSADEWAKVLDINLHGTFYAAQCFARRLLAAGKPGSAIFVASMSGHIVNVPQWQASYSSSKAAVAHLAKSLAVEWAPGGIRVNSISPGYFLSQMTRQFTEANAELAASWVERIPV